ncbi:MAG TPA: 50S ribosomal protein L17 [Thermoanaerobaculia bacterium]|nr:50S ribosomal protein L17 [Thermoanaerobaculia bacterium]
MRHGMVNRKLGRKSAHRLAMFRNQLASLIDKERIITTLPKAKELRPQIERLITLGKNDSVHARREAARVVADDTIVAKLFGTIGPRFSTRPGGYTRIIKLGPRRGDAAEMAILELVERTAEEATPAEEPKKKAPAKKAAPKAEPEPEEKPKRTRKAAPKAEEEAEEKPKKTTRKKKTEE